MRLREEGEDKCQYVIRSRQALDGGVPEGGDCGREKGGHTECASYVLRSLVESSAVTVERLGLEQPLFSVFSSTNSIPSTLGSPPPLSSPFWVSSDKEKVAFVWWQPPLQLPFPAQLYNRDREP